MVRVVICDIKKEAAEKVASEIETKGGEAWAATVDVRSYNGVKNMVCAVLEHYGNVDILVNSGRILYSSKIEEISPEEWQKVIEVNLTGMKKSGHGKIVNIGSSAGRNVSNLGGAYYTASNG